jgi:hypothetical protein
MSVECVYPKMKVCCNGLTSMIFDAVGTRYSLVVSGLSKM